MKRIAYCIAAAMLFCASAHAQQQKPAKPKVGASKNDGHGSSKASQQQQKQSDQYRKNQAAQNKKK